MKYGTIRKVLALVLAFALTLPLAACGSGKPAQKDSSGSQPGSNSISDGSKSEAPLINGTTYVTIAGAASSGTWFLLANAMSAMLNDTYGKDGMIASAQSTSGTGEIVRLLGSEDINFGFVQGGTCADAYNAGITWDGEPATYLRTIGYCYPTYVQLVARKDSGIATLSDLAGRHVAVGQAGSSTEINSSQVCAAAGMDYSSDPSVLTAEYVMESDAADMLKNGQVDAGFVPAPINSATMRDLMSTGDFTIISIPNEIGEILTRDYNAAYYQSVIPGGSYEGFDEDIPTVAYGIYLMTTEDVDDDLVYALTKAVYENNDVLANTYAGIAAMTPEMASIGAPAPMAAGAERYFKEIGAM